MTPDRIDARFQTPRTLAGLHYNDMIRSKDATMEYLLSPDYSARLAAVLLCETTWKCGADSRLIAACREMAASDVPDSFRMVAVRALGRALSFAKSAGDSEFLANLIMDSSISGEVRTDAYWALREIQFGNVDSDFDTFLKGVICTIKSINRVYPERFSEEDAKSDITPRGRFPDGFWESAEEIDWEFVRRFATSR
jgi:hypothetical protein